MRDKGYDAKSIGAITPFNCPLNLVAHKVGPAIAVGNTVVLKPANQTPLSSYALVELFEEAGLPKGALNIVSDLGSTVGEAIERVNHSRYGLQAGVFTNNFFKAMRVIDELEVGGVMINDIPTFRIDHMPYGGVKESGTGREGIKYAIEEMTEMKLVCIKK